MNFWRQILMLEHQVRHRARTSARTCRLLRQLVLASNPLTSSIELYLFKTLRQIRQMLARTISHQPAVQDMAL